MSDSARETFATQVDAKILADLLALARDDGRAHVMGAYLASHETYAGLYKKLAE